VTLSTEDDDADFADPADANKNFVITLTDENFEHDTQAATGGEVWELFTAHPFLSDYW
jgi:hypothetical protein